MTTRTPRSRNLVVRVADDELEMMHAIADEERETAATLIRRWIRQHHSARFGVVQPLGAAGGARR
jgi:hypothetical protein